MQKRKGSIGRRNKVHGKKPKVPQEGNAAVSEPAATPASVDVSSNADSEQSVLARHNQHSTDQVENSGHGVGSPALHHFPNGGVAASTASVDVLQVEQLPVIVQQSPVLGSNAWFNDPRISECVDRPIPGRADVQDYDSDDSDYIPGYPADSLVNLPTSQWVNDPNINAGAGTSTSSISDVPHTVSLIVSVQIIEQIPNIPQDTNITSADVVQEVIFVTPRISPNRKRGWTRRKTSTSTTTDVNDIPDGVSLVVNEVEVVSDVPQSNGDNIPDLRNFAYPVEWCTLDDLIPTDIDMHSCGELNSICIHCNALCFPEERKTRGKYVHCCKDGRISLNPIGPHPQLILDLFMGNHQKSEHFLKNLRKYNSALSFASIKAASVHIPGRQTNTFYAIQGKMPHRIAYSMRPRGNATPRYGQSYIFDAEEALRQRANIDVEHDLDLDLLRQLDRELPNANPFAQSYMLMRQVEEEVLARDGPDAIKNIRMFFTDSNPSAEVHRGRLNAPVATDVAIIYRSTTGGPPMRSFCIYPISGGIQELSRVNRHCDPMTYALLYPSGGSGWSIDLSYSFLQHYLYRFAVKENDNNVILRSRKLFQEYIVYAYVAIEAQRLQYLKTHQSDLRRDSYLRLQDHVRNRATDAGIQAGIPVILPSTFVGGPRSMQQAFQDSMAVVVKYGKPDLFITFTCNPRWPEITKYIFNGQKYIDRADLVARVFEMKLKTFLNNITKKNIFGRVGRGTYGQPLLRRPPFGF